MRKKRVKALKKQFEEEFGRPPLKSGKFNNDEFRRYKKDYNNNKHKV